MGCGLSTALRCSAMSISPICSSARRWVARPCRAVFSGNCRSHTSTGTQAGAETRAGGLSSTAHTVTAPRPTTGTSIDSSSVHSFPAAVLVEFRIAQR
jgi:hypothetical protein